MYRIAALFILFLFSTLPLSSQILDPVSWKFEVIQTENGTHYFVAEAKMDPGWTIYSQTLENEDGPISTFFDFETDINIPIEECGNKIEGYDKIFEMDVAKFKGYGIFYTVLPRGISGSIRGFAEYQTCDDTQCLPPQEEDFDLSLADAISFNGDINELCNVGLGGIKTAPTEAINPAEKENSSEPSQSEKKGISGIDLPEDEGPTTEVEMPGGEDGILDPVKWDLEVNYIKDDLYEAVFTVHIEENWNIYSYNLEKDKGPVPTDFYFDKIKGYELIGDLREEGKNIVEEYDPFFESDLAKVKGSATYIQRFRSIGEGDTLSGYFEYMACDPTQCLPPADVDFAIQPSSNLSYLSTDEAVIRMNTGTMGKGTPVYEVFNYERIKNTCSNEEVIEEDKEGMWWIFLAGFAGGLLALLTPCVFPMIPLTVSYFTKGSEKRSRAIKNAVIYGLSIIVIYVLLGLIITSVFGASALNALSTDPWFNLFFFALFIIFALSFFGLFEITLPASWANSSDAAVDKGGLLGIFFMAFTLALVSFSCTGPIIGTLLVETVVGGGATLFGRIPTGPLVGMLGFSTALALPFTLFAAFPGWLHSLPRSGGWMNSIKVALGFVEVALAFKFLSVADLTAGWKILPYELFLAVWIVCAIGLAAYFFGWINFPYDSPVKKRVSTATYTLGGVFALLAIYMSFGFTYDKNYGTFVTPDFLSGLAPPAGHSYIYPTKCPLGLNCFKDYYEAREYARKVNKPLFIDFTGHGCVNCRKMENNVWTDDGIYDLINEKFVLVSLYVDEKTKLDSPYVSSFDEDTKETIGDRWSDFQALHFNKNSQPYYVLAHPDGTILNKPVAYTPNSEKFESFLTCGIASFNDKCGGCLSGELEKG